MAKLLDGKARRLQTLDVTSLAPRRATAADAAALNALARSAYEIYVAVIGREPMPMAADWAKLLDEQEVWIIDGPTGDAAASLALEIKPDHIIVWSVAVAPAH